MKNRLNYIETSVNVDIRQDVPIVVRMNRPPAFSSQPAEVHQRKWVHSPETHQGPDSFTDHPALTDNIDYLDKPVHIIGGPVRCDTTVDGTLVHY